jgi:hypothetical protein
MEEQIISSVFKREEIWNPKNPSHKNVNIHKLWLEIAEEVGKDGTLSIYLCAYIINRTVFYRFVYILLLMNIQNNIIIN